MVEGRIKIPSALDPGEVDLFAKFESMFLNYIIKGLKLTSGLIENKLHSRILIITMVAGDILLLGGMVFGVFQTREMIYLSAILATFFCVCFGTGLRNLAKIQEKLLFRIMTRVKATHPDWPSFVDKKITERAEARMERNYKVEFILIFIFLTFCFYCPYFNFITKPGITWDHPDLQVVPYFYASWETKSFQQHLYKRFFESLTCLSCMVGYLTFTIFTAYTITNLEVHIEEMNWLLRNAIMVQVEKYMTLGEIHTFSGTDAYDSYVMADLSENRKREFFRAVNGELSKIIQYHQFVHRFIVDVNKFLQKPYGVVLSWFISSTILFTFVSLQVNKDYIFIMKVMSLVIHQTLAFHLYCNMAQIIHQANESIMDSFYNTSWYYFSPKTRKNFLLALTLCQRKYQVKCFGMYAVNLNLFIYASRTVYSAINILRATQKK